MSYIVPIWNITEYSPKEGTTEGGEEIEIKIKQEIYYTIAYCKFGEKTVFATDIKRHSLKCKAPQHEAGVVEFRVTFNNNDWNMILPQTYTFRATVKEKSVNALKIGTVIGGVLILLGGVYFMFKTPLTMKTEDENVPLLTQNSSPL